jgi:hypothetical protein
MLSHVWKRETQMVVFQKQSNLVGHPENPRGKTRIWATQRGFIRMARWQVLSKLLTNRIFPHIVQMVNGSDNIFCVIDFIGAMHATSFIDTCIAYCGTDCCVRTDDMSPC